MQRNAMGEPKRHYKMFKAGKHWAFMAITTVGIASGMAMTQGASASAQTNDEAVTTTATTAATSPETTAT